MTTAEKIASLLLLFIGTLFADRYTKFTPPLTMYVKEEVVDVRAKPEPHSDKYEYDPLQETQIVKGEKVTVFERRGKWARIECPEQMEFTHNKKWQGYPGWVLYGTLTEKVSFQRKTIPPPVISDELRQQIISMAEKNLGSPYLWGGRSYHDGSYKKALTGVDCSGLVHLAYWSLGWFIPRDAHEQFMRAATINPSELRPADLIFLAAIDKPDKIVHVVMYKGNGDIIEAPQSGEVVRTMSFDQRFGRPLEGLTNGTTIQDRVLYSGTFFKEMKEIKESKEMPKPK